MKKSIYPLILIALLFASCDEDIPTCENCDFTCLEENEPDVATNECLENWECEFVILPQSEVEISEVKGIVVGDKNVFKVRRFQEGSPEIADDEVSITIIFELDQNQKSFSAEGNDLKNMKVHYKKSCYCPDVRFLEVSSGCMQGELQSDGAWFIQGRFSISTSELSIEEKFEARFIN